MSRVTDALLSSGWKRQPPPVLDTSCMSPCCVGKMYFLRDAATARPDNFPKGYLEQVTKEIEKYEDGNVT